MHTQNFFCNQHNEQKVREIENKGLRGWLFKNLKTPTYICLKINIQILPIC